MPCLLALFSVGPDAPRPEQGLLGLAFRPALSASLLVLVSWAIGRPMNLVFANPLELVAIAGAAFAVNAIAQDGETTWFEGVLLLAVYALLGLAFFFVR